MSRSQFNHNLETPEEKHNIIVKRERRKSKVSLKSKTVHLLGKYPPMNLNVFENVQHNANTQS